MPEHDHTAPAAKPTALFPRPVSICRGTKIIGMFLPRWLFRARLTLSAVFFRHFSRPPAAPRLLPANFRSLPLPRLRATGPGASAAPACLCLPAAPCAAHFADFCPCLHFFPAFAQLFLSPPVISYICSALLFMARPFLRFFAVPAHAYDSPTFSLSRSPAFSACLFCLRFPTPFTCACPAFPFAIPRAFRLRLPRFSFCDFPALSVRNFNASRQHFSRLFRMKKRSRSSVFLLSAYSLEPVSISEPMIIFWKIANRMMTGRTHMTAAAMTGPWFASY